MRSVPGLNAVHIINGLRLNDKTDANGVPILPRVRLTNIQGWNNRPAMEDRRTTFVGRALRENFLRTQLDGKPLVYEGVIEARDQDELEEYMGLLTNGFASVEVMAVIVEPYYSDANYFYRGRITAFDPPEELPSSINKRYVFSRSFTLGFYMADPRKYREDLQVRSTNDLPSQTLPVGTGVLLPALIPMALPSVAQTAPIVDTSNGSTVIVHNDGSAPTDPIIEVRDLDTNTIIVQNESIGTKRLTLSANVGRGAVLCLDFFNRQITRDGVDVSEWLDGPGSDWWDPGVPGLKSGDNYLNLISGGKSLRVRYWHANN